MAVDVFNREGDLSYKMFTNHLFGDVTVTSQHRRNAKWCVGIPCFSKQVYAISYYAYATDLERFVGNTFKTQKVSMGFDLLTSHGIVEGFKFVAKVPCSNVNMDKIHSLVESNRVRKELFEALVNLEDLISDLEVAKSHLVSFYGLTFA